MNSKRILVLGSYPVGDPRHGGQVRLSRIVSAYRGRGLQVCLATFYPAYEAYESARQGPGDVSLPPQALQSWRGQVAPFIEDLASGDWVAASEPLLEALERRAGVCDVVHLEQPWLLPVVDRLRERGRIGGFRLVYGSQNVEHRLKRQIFEQYAVQDGALLIEAIERLEQACARASDLVAAVTHEDAQYLAGWASRPPLLAANGIEPWQVDTRLVSDWRQRLGPQPLALYVASAHPPNISGFGQSFGACLAPLAPGQRVVLAGSVASHIVESPWFRAWGPLNQQRVVVLGTVSQADLAALRELAHTFILPITSGGGSNLKTAEALYARRQVVATPLALRGFEAYSDLPGLTVVPPGPVFGQAVARSLGQPLPATDLPTQARLDQLTWAHSLRELVDVVERLPLA